MKNSDYERQKKPESDTQETNAVKEFLGQHKKAVRGVKIGLVGLACLIGVCNTVYTVPKDSVGVVETFGKCTRTARSGLNGKVPFIEKVNPVRTNYINSETFGFRELKSAAQSTFIGPDNIGEAPAGIIDDILRTEGSIKEGDKKAIAADILRNEYLCLTGDQNMADVEYVFQYQIANPIAYLYNVKDPVITFRNLAEATMKEITGDRSVDEILTVGRSDIELAAKTRMQEYVDLYKMGILVTLCKLQSTHPPMAVRPAFKAVNDAQQQKQTLINNAMTDYNRVIPNVRGDSGSVVLAANGYAAQKINNAQGDANRFLKNYTEYKKNPQINRARIWYETVPTVLENAQQVIFVEENQKGSGLLLKKLDLDASTNGGAKQ